MFKRSFFVAAALVAAMSPVTSFAQKDASVRIINRSPTPIFFLYTSPAGSPSYGKTDLLALQGVDVIDTDSSAVINFDVRDGNNKCVQDVLAVGRDGRKWKWTMNVCNEASWTLNH